MIGALVFAEFGSRVANAGGVYTYLNKAFGPMFGFLYGWCLLIVISSGTIAALPVTTDEKSKSMYKNASRPANLIRLNTYDAGAPTRITTNPLPAEKIAEFKSER